MSDRCIAMLALERPATVSAERLAARIKRQSPDAALAGKSVEAKSSQAAPDAPIVMDRGGTQITVLFMEEPIPDRRRTMPSASTECRWKR